MKVRIKYRVHGAAETVLQPGQVVDLDEDTALDIMRLGAAENMEGTAETALPLTPPLTPKKAKAGARPSLGPAEGAPAPESGKEGSE